MSIPLSASEKSEFTPASLANLPVAPVFLFRPATRRDARAFWQLCAVKGLTLHQSGDIRSAIRVELQKLWDQESFDLEMPRLQSLWDTLDYNSGLPKEQQVPIDPGEQAAADTLMKQLFAVSEPLRQMMVDNDAFMADAPKLALGYFMIGWRGINAPQRKVAGSIPLDCIDGLEEALLAVEKEAAESGVEGVEPGAAFAELAIHAFNLLSLTGAEAGNSALPSAPGPTPNSSSPAHSPPAMTAGGSPKLGRSKKTPAGASAVPTSN